jgi:hypothetical protein
VGLPTTPGAKRHDQCAHVGSKRFLEAVVPTRERSRWPQLRHVRDDLRRHEDLPERHVLELRPKSALRFGAMSAHHGSVAAVSRLLREIEALLKHPSVTMELGHRGVNASLTLLAVQGLTAYVEGNRRQAHEDFATVAEEIRTRLER